MYNHNVNVPLYQNYIHFMQADPQSIILYYTTQASTFANINEEIPRELKQLKSINLDKNLKDF